MKKHLYYYPGHIDYQNDISRNLPNVSYCNTQDEVHFEPKLNIKIIGTYLVTNSNVKTKICNISNQSLEEKFDKIEIDNNEISLSDIDNGKYQLSAGEHIVEYTLSNPTIITDQFFSQCRCLTNIQLPEGIKEIRSSVFLGCTGLTSVTIPNSVTSILYGTFNECTNLTSVTLSNNITEINDIMFWGCTNLTNVIIPNGVTIIKESAFEECTSLISLTIPSSVTTIEDYCFCSCSSLNNATRTAISNINPNALECEED